MAGTPEWFQVFDSHNVWVMDILAYTATGAIQDAKQQGHDAASAFRLYRNLPMEVED